MLPAALMIIDPGTMTGMSELLTLPSFPGPHNDMSRYPLIRIDEFDFFTACNRIEAICAMYAGGLVLGWERFDIDAETHKKTRAGIYDALHVIGVCRYQALKWGCRALTPLQRHTPDARDRERLSALGWWVPGKDDAQSAGCHLLRYLESQNELTPAQRDILYGK